MNWSKFRNFMFGNKYRTEFNLRAPLSDSAFMERCRRPERLTIDVVAAYRARLGEMYKSPPEKFLPEDTFDDLEKLPQTIWWDVVGLVMAVEDALGISLDEKLLGHADRMKKGQTIGDWLVGVVAAAKRV